MGDLMANDFSPVVVLRKGVFYFPASDHYSNPNNPNPVVNCDRCNQNNLPCCIGFQNYDLCLSCADAIVKASVDASVKPGLSQGVLPQMSQSLQSSQSPHSGQEQIKRETAPCSQQQHVGYFPMPKKPDAFARPETNPGGGGFIWPQHSEGRTGSFSTNMSLSGNRAPMSLASGNRSLFSSDNTPGSLMFLFGNRPTSLFSDNQPSTFMCLSGSRPMSLRDSQSLPLGGLGGLGDNFEKFD